MTLKKLTTLAMATVVSASLLVGCSGNNESAENDKITVAMITDVAGVNDQSFNQSAWEGLQQAEKELGVEVKYLESKQDSDYATNIETLVDEDVDLILGVGMKLSDAIKEGAELYPDQNFVIVDEELTDISNVKSILFNAQESAYLAGLVAGKTTKTDNVGFIGGMQLPTVDTFKYGFMAGVKAVNPDATIQVQYANSFTDQAKGKGSIEAAKENGKFAIGVDRDQSDLAPENVLTSAIKRVDVGVYETVKAYLDGTFEGGTTTIYGLEDNAVGIPDTTKNLVSQEILDLVEETITKLKNKEITVPKNEEEYNAMVK